MAVAIDNTGKTGIGIATAGVNITSFAVGSGSNRLIYLAVSQYSNPDRTPSATFKIFRKAVQ